MWDKQRSRDPDHFIHPDQHTAMDAVATSRSLIAC